MKVIILKSEKNLGKLGEVREVSDGYARNFLIPRGLAKAVSPQEIKRLTEEQEAIASKAQKELKKVQEQAAAIDGLEVEMSEKASEAGTLYSALSAAKIAKALKAKGFEIEKKQIKIDRPIKELGEHEVLIVFEHGLEVKIKIILNEALK